MNDHSITLLRGYEARTSAVLILKRCFIGSCERGARHKIRHIALMNFPLVRWQLWEYDLGKAEFDL